MNEKLKLYKESVELATTLYNAAAMTGIYTTLDSLTRELERRAVKYDKKAEQLLDAIVNR